MEAVYVRGAGRLVAGAIAAVTRVLPLSIAELVIVGLVLAAGGLLGRGAWALWRGARPSLVQVGRTAILLVGIALAVADVFVLVWGMSYARPPIERRWGWSEGNLDDVAIDELARLGAELVDEVNDRYRLLHGTDDAGAPTSRQTGARDVTWSDVDMAIDRGFVRLQATHGLHPDLAVSRGPAKRLWLSPIPSWMGISGFYFPFTAEANVNRMPPEWQQPFTTAHEKAHQRFVASENEANFYGFLACIYSDDPFVQYSGYLFAQRQVLRALRTADPETFVEQIERRLPGVQRDVNAAYAFWTGYQGPVREASRAVNDAYLKANGVQGGVRSYGRSLQLIVRFSRDRAGRWPDVPVGEEM